MKKIAIVIISLFLLGCFSVGVWADVVTTSPQESTVESTVPEGYEEGLVRYVDITAPIAICFVLVCAFSIYGIIKLKKAKKDEFKI